MLGYRFSISFQRQRLATERLSSFPLSLSRSGHSLLSFFRYMLLGHWEFPMQRPEPKRQPGPKTMLSHYHPMQPDPTSCPAAQFFPLVLLCQLFAPVSFQTVRKSIPHLFIRIQTHITAYDIQSVTIIHSGLHIESELLQTSDIWTLFAKDSLGTIQRSRSHKRDRELHPDETMTTC